MVNKRLINTGVEAAPAAFDPLQNFETVTYTGNGGTQKITGYIRKGAAFASSGSYIVTGSGLYEAARGTNGTSVSFWMRSTGNNYETPIYTRTASAAAGWHIRTSTGGNGINWNWQNSSGSVVFVSGEETVTLTDGWHHVVATWDGTTSTDGAKLYIDGSLFDSLTASATLASQTFTLSPTLGNDRQSGGRGIGTLDQVRFFDKALSSSEVTTLYGETYASSTKSTTDIFGDGSGVALYELDEDALSSNFEQAASFNGSSSYISTPNPLGTGNVAYSISAWINLNSSSHTGGIYTIWDGGATSGTYIFFKVASGSISIGNYGSSITSSNTLSTNQWVNVVVTRDTSNNVVLYVNGASDTTGTLSLNLGNHSAKIGALASSIETFNGKIDQVRIFDTALSSSDVTKLYNESSQIPTTNLIAHYKLDGDATDSVGSYDGTASNVTYTTGVYGGTPTNVNFLGMAFQPDLVWIKNRTTAASHIVHDSIRGAGISKNIYPDFTGYEGEYGSYGFVSSFDSNGFSVDASTNAYHSNRNGDNYVAWCWKAGGAAVSNTDGSITSTVSANQDAGFSIVKFTTDGSATGLKVGHGLSSTPEFIIYKILSTGDWYVLSSEIDNYYLVLNSTSAKGLTDAYSTYASSTLINNFTPANNVNYIAYCFHSVTGYQKIGSYSGTGVNGNSITIGFQPRWLLVKRINTADNWVIVDTVRGLSNSLFPDDPSQELNNAGAVSFNSNGFTVNGNSGGWNNGTSTYIYLAIA